MDKVFAARDSARQALAKARRSFATIPASYGGKERLGETIDALEALVGRMSSCRLN